MPDELAAGSTLRQGTYRIEKVLGRGGFGITYLGTETALARPVAVKEHFPWGCARMDGKVQPGTLAPDEYRASLARFAREARLLSRFEHPNIARVLTVFEEAGTAYLVMEYVVGRPLSQTSLPLDPDLALGWLQQLISALQVIHDAGLLHRDLKPDNILLNEAGRVVLIDFGAAREANAGSKTTIVSPGYSPPEQYSQTAPWAPSLDFYSLGATFYHLLTGVAPPSSLDRLSGTQLIPARDLRREIPGPLSELLGRCLQMEAARRPSSVRELESQVPAARGTPSSEVPPPGGTRATPSSEVPPQGEARATPPASSSPEGPVQPLKGHRGWVRALAFHRDGEWLASGAEDRTVRIWADGAELARLEEHKGWVTAILFRGDELITAGHDRRVLLWECGGWGLRQALPGPDVPTSLALWDDQLVIGYQKGAIEILEGQEVTRRLQIAGAVQALLTTGEFLLAASGEERIYVFDRNGQLLEKLGGHSGGVRCLARLEDGQVASGGSDKKVLLWNVERGESQHLGSHTGTVRALAAAGSGFFYSASGDKSVRSWPGGRTVGQHAGEATALAYHPRQGLASGGQDDLIRFWS